MQKTIPFDIASARFMARPDGEPIGAGSGVEGRLRMAGAGKRTSEKCGVFSSFYGCNRTHLHDHVGLDGVNYKGKVLVHPVFFGCNKVSCPICYEFGFAGRESRNIETRLKEASRMYGQVEHLAITFPTKYWHLATFVEGYRWLRNFAIEVCRSRGVIGGVLIFHGFRYNTKGHWYLSPHFHVLGFIKGGYKCRSCTKQCFKGCGGFRDRSYRAFEKDGCVVEVFGERETVGGSAWYQLNHASYLDGVKRFHVATWFGVASYRRLKVVREDRFKKCSICGSEFVKLQYVGHKREVLEYTRMVRRGSGNFDFIADGFENGVAVWELMPEVPNGCFDNG